jgi:N-acetylgalactosamine-6-sulfatase
VIFSSDNGPARASKPTAPALQHDTASGPGYGIGAAKGITGGRKGYKASLFEGGVGVPFIARWPGKIAAGKVDETSLISAVDLLPTFCEIAGAKLPASYKPDGVSQVDVLTGTPAPVRNTPLFWKAMAPWPAQKAKPDHWVSYAVVQQNWKLVTNRDGSHIELYDVAADPYEKTDLKAQKPEATAKLKKLLTDWQATLPEAPSGNVFSNLRKK